MKRNMRKAITIVLAIAFILTSLTVATFMFSSKTASSYGETVTEENTVSTKKVTCEDETVTVENTKTVEKEVLTTVETSFTEELLPEESTFEEPFSDSLSSEETNPESESEKETQA